MCDLRNMVYGDTKTDDVFYRFEDRVGVLKNSIDTLTQRSHLHGRVTV